jgi:4-hydroxy-L-threonine phosphate dehydrogenase PdxA
MARPIRVGISHGDINGISYEIILKAVGAEGFTEVCTPVIFGTSKLVSFYRKALGIGDFYFRQVSSAEERSMSSTYPTKTSRSFPALRRRKAAPLRFFRLKRLRRLCSRET